LGQSAQIAEFFTTEFLFFYETCEIFTQVDLFDKFCYIIYMRLNKQQCEHMAFSIVNELLKENLIITEDKEKMVAEVHEIITRELEREDLLDEQVKEILKEKLNEIRNANIDYYEMFKMVKAKLAEKENIIL
jgi:hypothetical protein